MTPLQFLSFRDRLDSASGFQSAGFRQIEAMLGSRDLGRGACAARGFRGAPGDRGGPGRARRSGTRSSVSWRGAATRAAGCRRPRRARPGDHRGRLPRRRRRGARRGAARRPRRGHPGVALPPREDGRTDDRHEARHGRIERRRVPARRPCSGRRSPTCGRSARGCRRARSHPNRNAQRAVGNRQRHRRYPSPPDPSVPRGPPHRPRPAIHESSKSGGAHEGRCRQGDRARRAARRPGTRSARQAAGGRARDPRRVRRRRRRRRFPDSAYEDAGATVVSTDELYEQSDVILRVAKPSAAEVEQLRKGQAVVGFLAPLIDPELAKALADQGVTAISLDAIPRTLSRAQTMDALRSQANVGGYKAVLIAANAYGRYFPLLTTAAGTAKPANVLILGHRRGRAPGDRHRAAARRRRQGLRRPARDPRAGREPRRPVRQAQDHDRRDRRRRLRPRAHRRGARRPAGRAQRGHRRDGRRHHHGPGPGSQAAGARHRGRGRQDEAGLGHRGHGRLGPRRQLRALARPARRS